MSEENSIEQRMISIMSDIGAIGKDQQNNFHRYNFRGIDDVMNALHPIMVKYGVFLQIEVIEKIQTDRLSKKQEIQLHTVLTVKYTFSSVDGNVESIVIGEGLDTSDKSYNKAMSAALKYLLLQTFLIPTQDIVDADKTSPQVENKNQAPQNKPPQKKETPPNLEKLKETILEKNPELPELLMYYKNWVIKCDKYNTDPEIKASGEQAIVFRIQFMLQEIRTHNQGDEFLKTLEPVWNNNCDFQKTPDAIRAMFKEIMYSKPEIKNPDVGLQMDKISYGSMIKKITECENIGLMGELQKEVNEAGFNQDEYNKLDRELNKRFDYLERRGT
jgi:hypothetical protein